MVVKKKADKNWEYCIYLGQDENGKKKYKRKCGFKTRKECIREANIFKNNNNFEHKDLKTFKEILYLTLSNSIRSGLRRTTVLTYESHVKFIVNNFLHINKPINNITVDDIYNFINIKLNSKSTHYKHNIFFFIKYAFKYALKQKLITNNICEEIKISKNFNTSKNIWSEKEIQEYLPILKKFKHYNLLLIVLETGLRRGEVCALTWDCVDFNKNTIKVNKSYVIHGKFTSITYPKTPSSIREIVLLKESIKILKQMYTIKKSEYIFPDNHDINKPINPIILSRNFQIFLKKHNIKKIRFHDLRHIHATLLLNKNINYKVISKRLGHTNISFTLQTYTHVLPDQEVELFKNLSNIF